MIAKCAIFLLLLAVVAAEDSVKRQTLFDNILCITFHIGCPIGTTLPPPTVPVIVKKETFFSNILCTTFHVGCDPAPAVVKRQTFFDDILCATFHIGCPTSTPPPIVV